MLSRTTALVSGSITIPHLRRAFAAWEELQGATSASATIDSED